MTGISIYSSKNEKPPFIKNVDKLLNDVRTNLSKTDKSEAAFQLIKSLEETKIETDPDSIRFFMEIIGSLIEILKEMGIDLNEHLYPMPKDTINGRLHQIDTRRSLLENEKFDNMPETKKMANITDPKFKEQKEYATKIVEEYNRLQKEIGEYREKILPFLTGSTKRQQTNKRATDTGTKEKGTNAPGKEKSNETGDQSPQGMIAFLKSKAEEFQQNYITNRKLIQLIQDYQGRKIAKKDLESQIITPLKNMIQQAMNIPFDGDTKDNLILLSNSFYGTIDSIDTQYPDQISRGIANNISSLLYCLDENNLDRKNKGEDIDWQSFYASFQSQKKPETHTESDNSNVEKLKDEIYKLVADNQIEKVFDKMLKFYEGKEGYKEVIILSFLYKIRKRDSMLGITQDRDHSTVKGILSFPYGKMESEENLSEKAKEVINIILRGNSAEALETAIEKAISLHFEPEELRAIQKKLKENSKNDRMGILDANEKYQNLAKILNDLLSYLE